ncbi:MAG: hypothetical protein BWK78_01425 [Thiotrichaceae bacterium IS1]|nr:MAG: hypothetical protein BWK78_01425 [Thiotrichaceae bacterium IS1]
MKYFITFIITFIFGSLGNAGAADCFEQGYNQGRADATNQCEITVNDRYNQGFSDGQTATNNQCEAAINTARQEGIDSVQCPDITSNDDDIRKECEATVNTVRQECNATVSITQQASYQQGFDNGIAQCPQCLDITSNDEAIRQECDITSNDEAVRQECDITSNDEAVRQECDITSNDEAIRQECDITSNDTEIRQQGYDEGFKTVENVIPLLTITGDIATGYTADQLFLPAVFLTDTTPNCNKLTPEFSEQLTSQIGKGNPYKCITLRHQTDGLIHEGQGYLLFNVEKIEGQPLKNDNAKAILTVVKLGDDINITVEKSDTQLGCNLNGVCTASFKHNTQITLKVGENIKWAGDCTHGITENCELLMDNHKVVAVQETVPTEESKPSSSEEDKVGE